MIFYLFVKFQLFICEPLISLNLCEIRNFNIFYNFSYLINLEKKYQKAFPLALMVWSNERWWLSHCFRSVFLSPSFVFVFSYKRKISWLRPLGNDTRVAEVHRSRTKINRSKFYSDKIGIAKVLTFNRANNPIKLWNIVRWLLLSDVS